MMFITNTTTDFLYVREVLQQLEKEHRFEELEVITTSSENDEMILQFLTEVGASIRVINFNLFHEDNLLRQLSEMLNCLIIIGELKTNKLKTLFKYCDDNAEYYGNKISFKDFSKAIHNKLEENFEMVYEAYKMSGLATENIYKAYIDDFIKNTNRTLIKIYEK